MEIDEYLYTLDELLDGVEIDDSMAENLACTVFAIGKQLSWDVEIYYDEEGCLITDVYK
jgi:hypothetical protein